MTLAPVPEAPSPKAHVNVYGASPPLALAAKLTWSGATPVVGEAESDVLRAMYTVT